MVCLNHPNLGVKDFMHKQTNEGMNARASEYLCPQDMNMATGAYACRRVCGCGGGVGIIMLLDIDWTFVSLEGSNNFQTLAT